MKSANKISEELDELQSKLPKTISGSGFVVEEEYFLTFPLIMLRKINLVEFGSSFSVPTKYFEEFPLQVLSAIKQHESEAEDEFSEISPLLSKIDKKMPFQVPEGYFSHSPVIPQLQADSENLPDYLKKEVTYLVPENYFEELPSVILKKLSIESGAKVIKMNTSYSRWRYYAAAVIVVGLLLTGAWFLNQPDSSNTPAIENLASGNLDEIPAAELHAYLETQAPVMLNQEQEENSFSIENENFEIMFTNLSDQDLQEYLTEYVGMVN